MHVLPMYTVSGVPARGQRGVHLGCGTGGVPGGGTGGGGGGTPAPCTPAPPSPALVPVPASWPLLASTGRSWLATGRSCPLLAPPGPYGYLLHNPVQFRSLTDPEDTLLGTRRVRDTSCADPSLNIPECSWRCPRDQPEQ